LQINTNWSPVGVLM